MRGVGCLLWIEPGGAILHGGVEQELLVLYTVSKVEARWERQLVKGWRLKGNTILKMGDNKQIIR